MQAKFLVIGDLHIHLNNLEETEILGQFLVRTASELQPDVIVVLGDILHTNNVLRSEAHVPATELLGELSEIAPLLVIMGNHDVPGPLAFLSKYHGFTALKRWSGTKKAHVIFPSATGVQLVDTAPVLFSVNGIYFAACPYIPPGRFEEALNYCEDWKSAKAIFCHQEISNCDLGHGHRSESKDVWPAHYPHIISGHIHKYQRLAENVLYGGSPRQVTVAEEYYKTIAELVFSEQGHFTETRIFTGLEPRAHLKIYSKEVDSVEVPPSGRVKIEITGTVAENNVVRKCARVREWRRKGFTVKFHDFLEDTDREALLNTENANLGFKNLCRLRAEEEGLGDEYREIFD